jgi:very-short-patch-repair endonuclease
MVEKVLKENKIKYETQYKVKKLGRQSFDFYLPEKDIYIEYDGKQHFTPNTLFGSKEIFKKQQENDKKKDIYCGDKLLRIKYTINNINKIKELIMEKINEN